MEESSGKSFDPATWFNLWMQSAGDMLNAIPQPDLSGFVTPKAESTGSDHTGKWLNDQIKTWQSVTSAMSQPDALSAYLKDTASLPEPLTSLIMPMMTTAAELLQNMGQTNKAGDFVSSFNFTNPDKYAFDLWRNLYDQEFRKFLNIPQLGLTRQYQEKANRLLDRFNMLQAAMAEFLHLLCLPFEKTQAAYSQKLAEDAKKNELPKDFKSQYMIWLKMLEGHYMTLFKTPEYLASLSKTISAAAEYSLAKKSLTDDLLKILSIPSSDTIEGIYKELYDMKKRLKDMEKTIKTIVQR